jgi:hypothetical protein
MRADVLVASLEECLLLQSSFCAFQMPLFGRDLALTFLNVIHHRSHTAKDTLAGYAVDLLLGGVHHLTMSVEASSHFELTLISRLNAAADIVLTSVAHRGHVTFVGCQSMSTD